MSGRGCKHERSKWRHTSGRVEPGDTMHWIECECGEWLACSSWWSDPQFEARAQERVTALLAPEPGERPTT